MSSSVFLTKRADKQLKRIPRHKQIKLDKKILVLQQNPLAGKLLEGELAQLRSVRAWPYRIIYKFSPQQNSIQILKIEHRQRVYRRR